MEDDSKSLSYFFLGLGVGIAAGIMFAPQAGAETRGTIRRKATESGDALKRRTEELRDSAGNLVDRGRDLINKQREQLSSAVDAGKQAYRDTIDQTRSTGTPETGDMGGTTQGI